MNIINLIKNKIKEKDSNEDSSNVINFKVNIDDDNSKTQNQLLNPIEFKKIINNLDNRVVFGSNQDQDAIDSRNENLFNNQYNSEQLLILQNNKKQNKTIQDQSFNHSNCKILNEIKNESNEINENLLKFQSCKNFQKQILTEKEGKEVEKGVIQENINLNDFYKNNIQVNDDKNQIDNNIFSSKNNIINIPNTNNEKKNDINSNFCKNNIHNIINLKLEPILSKSHSENNWLLHPKININKILSNNNISNILNCNFEK